MTADQPIAGSINVELTEDGLVALVFLSPDPDTHHKMLVHRRMLALPEIEELIRGLEAAREILRDASPLSSSRA